MSPVNGGLWREHEATAKQQRMLRPGNSRERQTQADLLIAMLREASLLGKPLELPEIMRSGIAQHGARFNELRSRGFIIENKLQRNEQGVVRSQYWLRYDPERDGGDAK